jgi:UDP-N-acetylmuramoyl-L-alanyl-D-glutamate--2,6-diaminopimelate ligase
MYNLGITDDSRQVKKGYMFVAVKGLNFDGHDYIPDAIKNGATVVVGERDEKLPDGIEYVRVKDSREALGKYASEFYGNPSKKLKIIGVTGTKGKTTTCHIIYHVLTKLGKRVGLLSTISVPGFHVTTLDAVSLHKSLKDMVDEGYEYAVIEVSSHGIDQKRIAGVKFDVAVLTNIAPEHLDYHKTFEEYKKVKRSFINSAKNKVIAPRKTDINILPGEFNNLNAEAAVLTVSLFGIGRKEALEVVKTFRLPKGRLEEVKNSRGIKVFIDFAHTPESLRSVLEYLKTITKGRLIAVFGSAGERDPYKRPGMGEAVSQVADVIILTAEDPRSERVEDIISQIRGGVRTKKVKIFEIPDREKAIKYAIEIAGRGDVVGVFGKGHEKSMNLDGVHEIPWSDEKIVRKYLKNKKK